MSRGVGRAIAVNTIWMIGGKIVTTLLSLVVTAILARALGVYGYGEFTTAFAFMAFFGVIADFGFFQILVREVARRPEEEEAITGNIFALRSLFAVVVYGGGALLAWVFPYSHEVQLGIAILALASFFLSLNTTLIGVFQAHHQMYKAVAGDTISRVVLLATVYLAAVHFHWPLAGLLALYVVANLVNLGITMTFIPALVPLRLRFDWSAWRALFAEAWPLGVVTMLGIIYYRVDTVILSLLRAPTDVGIYGAPYKMLDLLVVVPSIFMGNVFPAITRLLHTDRSQVGWLIQAAFDTLLIVGFGMVGGLIVIAPAVIRIVAGPAFVAASTVQIFGHAVTASHILIILSIALIPIFLGNLWSPIVIALGDQRSLIKPGIWAVIINVVLNLIFIPQASYLAAGLITIITEIFIAVVWGVIAHRHIEFSLGLGRVAKAGLAALVMMAVIWPLRNHFVLLPILLGVAVYSGLLIVFGAVPKDFIGRLIRREL